MQKEQCWMLPVVWFQSISQSSNNQSSIMMLQTTTSTTKPQLHIPIDQYKRIEAQIQACIFNWCMTRCQEYIKCKMTVYSIIIVDNWILTSERIKLVLYHYIKLNSEWLQVFKVSSENTKLHKFTQGRSVGCEFGKWLFFWLWIQKSQVIVAKKNIDK